MISDNRGAIPTQITKDWLKRNHAQEQAKAIEAYWAARGHKVKTWLVDAPVEPARARKRERAYTVRSNLVNGMPRSAHG